MAFQQGWAGAFHCAQEKDKDSILFEHFPEVLNTSRGPHELNVWSRIQSWPPTQQSQLLIKHKHACKRSTGLIQAWPLDVQLHFLMNGGHVEDYIELVGRWPHKFQQAYYDKYPPQYEAAVDKAVLEDERRFRLNKETPSRSPEVWATRAYFMANYIVPDFCPASCGNAPAGIALAIGFSVYTTFHGVHPRMNPAWFADIMHLVIARLANTVE